MRTIPVFQCVQCPGIVADPRFQFGGPTISGTRIYPETIYSYYKGGDKKKFLLKEFPSLNRYDVDQAIRYCKLQNVMKVSWRIKSNVVTPEYWNDSLTRTHLKRKMK